MFRLQTCLLWITPVVLLIGCNPKSETITSNNSKYEAAVPEGDPGETVPGPTSPSPGANPSPSPNLPNPGPTDHQHSQHPTTPHSHENEGPQVNPALAPSVDSLIGTAPAAPKTDLQPLPDNATINDAMIYFEQANGAMQALMTGRTSITGVENVKREALRICTLKLKAAEFALAKGSANEETSVTLQRNKLEALSHLAGLRDVEAAKKLEAYAAELTTSSNPGLVLDGRIVMLGFEIDRIANGLTKDTDGVLKLLELINATEGDLGIPAFQSVHQAFMVLSQYGYTDTAIEMRDFLAKRYTGYHVKEIAQIAKQMSDAARYDEINALMLRIHTDTPPEAKEFEVALTNLLNKGKDVGSFHTIASLMLNAEGSGLKAVVELTRNAIEANYIRGNPNQALVTEATAFLKASVAREECIGKPIQVDYPDLAGVKVDWAAYRGSKVIMPFWVTREAQSFMFLGQLDSLLKNNPGKFKIVGINLDISDEELAPARSSMQLSFPTLRNPDPSTRGIMDPVAQQLGLASYPFLAIIDEQGNVERLLQGPLPETMDIVTASVLGESAPAEPAGS